MAHILTFGKYKYQKVDDMIDSNPKYIKWALDNVPYFKLSNSELIKLNSKLLGYDSYKKS